MNLDDYRVIDVAKRVETLSDLEGVIDDFKENESQYPDLILFPEDGYGPELTTDEFVGIQVQVSIEKDIPADEIWLVILMTKEK